MNLFTTMDFLKELFTSDSVAHAVVILSLVAALGLWIGSFRVFGINLGIAGVLFAGLLFGHFGLSLGEDVLDFVREFGLILFVYTIGVQVGPGFTASLKRQGMRLNVLAASIVALGVAVMLLVSYFGGIDMLAAVGLYSGGVTNTPSLGAAQQAVKDIPGITRDAAKLPGLGYAIAYPFGIVGTILSMIFIRLVFRINTKSEAEALAQQKKKSTASVKTANFEITNTNLNGLCVKDIPGVTESGVVISRIMKGDQIQIAQPETTLEVGDILLAVGPRKGLEQLKIVVGKESDIDLKEAPSNLITRRIIVTKKAALGKSLEELDLASRYNATITRVSRAEIEFTATSDFRLQFADTVLVVGEPDDVNKVAAELGNSVSRLNHPQMIPMFVGIALGIMLGSWPLHLPGMPAPVKLGLAGGPLVVAIILSRIGRIGPLIWYMPISANFTVREFGIVLFLACVGLKSGDEFINTLLNGNGFIWMAWATAITLLPLLIVGIVARAVYRINFVSLCGLLAGSMTDPPALAFAGAVTNSDGPSISYATVYPLVMLLRVISAQAIVILLAR